MQPAVHFTDIKTHILAHLNGAETSLSLAVSWLTDREIFNLLLDKLRHGLRVSLITRNDFLNNHSDALDWNGFIAAGGALRFSRDGGQLHYKFILADDRRVLCTSYNLTCFANGNNRENVMVFEEEGFVQKFVEEFKQLAATLPLQSQVARIQQSDVPAALHGFYESTLENDKKKQGI